MGATQAGPVKGIVQPTAAGGGKSIFGQPVQTTPGFTAQNTGAGQNTPGYIGGQIPVQLTPNGPLMVKGPNGAYVKAVPYGPSYGVSPSTPTVFTPGGAAQPAAGAGQTRTLQGVANGPTVPGQAPPVTSTPVAPPGPVNADAPTGVNPTGFNPTPPTPVGPMTAGDTPAGVGPTGYGAAPVETLAQKEQAILQSDPAYAQAQTDATQAQGDAASTRQAAIDQAVLQFGGVTPGFKDAYGDVSQAQIAAAQANPYSDMAQNARAFALTKAQQEQSGGAYGGFSGDTPTELSNQDYQHGLDLNTLDQNFGSTVGNAVGAFTGQLGTNRTNMTNATFAAEKDQSTNPAWTGLFTPSGPQHDTSPIPGPKSKPVTTTIHASHVGKYAIPPQHLTDHFKVPAGGL